MGAEETQSEHIARDVLESLLEGCQVIDRDYRYVYLNQAALEHARRPRDQLLGRTMMECFPGIEQTSMFRMIEGCMRDRAHHQMENEFEYPDGTSGWFELRFVPVPEGVCVLSLDVTASKRSTAELVRTEAQLRHAQKMEAVGRLAGGVAHDFNNVLSVVLSYTGLLLNDLKPDQQLRRDIEEIQKAGLRAVELTAQLMMFSRQQPVSLRVLDLNRRLRELQSMLERLLGADVELTLLCAPALGEIRADPSSIEQVVFNLAVNARDAMPSGGKLTIETKNVELDREYAREHIGVDPGPYVMLAFSDTGSGMDRDTQARIFEPFFTTKELGKGTGLGLSTVYGIVKQNRGHIWVYSEPGAGTTFKVYLRRTDESEEPDSSEPAPAQSVRGSETVLLVEDDSQVRTAASNILRRYGYRVLEAANAGEALLVCEEHAATIHLLLTDVVLPRMSGRTLAERLSKMRPQMKMLFMSGYTDDAVLQHGILESEVEYLQKPITPDLLTRKVRAVLDANPAR